MAENLNATDPRPNDGQNNLLAKILRRLRNLAEEFAGVTVIVQPSDIEIGAVEIKDTHTNTRAHVSESAPAANDAGLVVRNIPSGTQTVDGTVTVTPSGTQNVSFNGTAQPITLKSGSSADLGRVTTDIPAHDDPGLVVRPVYNGGQHILFDPPGQDSFGRLRISYPTTLFECKQLINNSPLLMDDQQVSGAGTSTTFSAAKCASTMAVSNLTAGVRVRQSYRRFNYQAGKSQLAFFTFTMGDATTGITRRVGLFDENNGVFLEQTEDGAFFVVRKGTADVTRVAQVDWNNDVLDGSGDHDTNHSGVLLDLSKSQIFFVDYEWLGVGVVRYGFVVNGALVICHTQKHSNLVTSVYHSNPNLPARYEIRNSGTGPAANMDAICCSVMSEGGADRTGIERSIDRGTTPLVTINDADLYPVLGIRLQAGALMASVDLSEFSLVCDSTANWRWALCINPTFTGVAPTWSNLANSAVAYCNTVVNTTKVSNSGTVLRAGYAVGTTQFAPTISGSIGGFLTIGSTIAGVPQELWLVAQRITGTTENFYASMAWREQV